MKPRSFKLDNKEKIIIRNVKRSDIEGIWENFNQVIEEGEYLPVFSPVVSEFEKKGWYNTLKDAHEICIIAENPKSDSPKNIVGQCEISDLEWEAAAHVGQLGIIVKQKYRDSGIGEQLIDGAIRESKKVNNKKKIILSCFEQNKRALHLYKKFGFTTVGIRKNQFYMNEKYYNEVLMELWIKDYLD
ncbi:MAG: N-acetyltransferase [Promethearchaeia archaeon]